GVALEEPPAAFRLLGDGLEQGTLSVAPHEERGKWERPETLERLFRQRAPGEVAAEDHQVRLQLVELRDDGLQRHGVAVDVRQDRDALCSAGRAHSSGST